MENVSDIEKRLTAYPAPKSTPCGAVIIFPGGAYAHLADHEGEPVARLLNGLGIAAFVLRYRHAPHRHPAPLMDAQSAVRYVRYHADRWHIKPNRIGVLGFSAGGHLAATLATHFDDGLRKSSDPVARVSCRPDAAVLCYPVVSFTENVHEGCVRNLLGDNPPPSLLESLSNEKQVTADTPPTFLWHTVADPGVPVENSLSFAAALRAHGVPFELHLFPHGRHGLGLAAEEDGVRQWPGLCGDWLLRNGF